MKIKHLSLVWEEISTMIRNICKKSANIYEDFFCKFFINEFRSVSY